MKTLSIQNKLIDFIEQHQAHFKRGACLLVACSGGPDSVALVRGLKSLEKIFQWKIHLGHINHRLRGRESEADARFVERLAGEMGWPFHLALQTVLKSDGNLEEAARVKRYNALWKMARVNKCGGILTAHTKDDQVETIFLNLLRGTGTDGLGGIHPVRHWPGSKIPLIRPFLAVSKSEILDFLKQHQFRYRRDKSNSDQNFSRNWVRNNLLPMIEKRAPGFVNRMSQTALMVRDEQAVWEGLLHQMKRSVLKETSAGTILDLKKLLRYPAAAQRRLLRWVSGKDLLTFEGVEGLRRWMHSAPTSGRFWQLRKGWMVERLSKSQGSPSAKFFMFKQSNFRINSKRNVTIK